MLDGADGSSLVITQITAAADPAYPKDFHFGIMMGPPEEVESKNRELASASLNPEKVQDFEAVGSTCKTFMAPLGDGMKVKVNSRTRS